MDRNTFVDARYISVKNKGQECGEFVPVISDPAKIFLALAEAGKIIGGPNGKSLVDRFGPLAAVLNDEMGAEITGS